MLPQAEAFAENSAQIINEVEKAVIGKREILMKLLAAFLCSGGHVLLEDNPGLAKTLVANSFATTLGLKFKRVQFTPDLLPGDITGGFIFDSSNSTFVLRKGPLFSNIILGDEINRASPKTQSALLEAMQEFQVTLEGDSFKLPEPFIVIATQNPIEYEGTFPLPEAQLDRFLIRLSIGYPDLEDEQQILAQRNERKRDTFELNSVITDVAFQDMRRYVESVYINSDIQRYICQLVAKTRHHKMIDLGASPRGSLALLKVSKAWAAIQGRNFVLPDDVKTFAHCALSHRIILDPNLWGSKKTVHDIIDEVIQSVPIPVAPSE
ncbi:MAG: MoxR family ATPase [Anaerolineaceae bacterium]|nr:MoxR family ATPase [Anaerolineaceae bacterium]